MRLHNKEMSTMFFKEKLNVIFASSRQKVYLYLSVTSGILLLFKTVARLKTEFDVYFPKIVNIFTNVQDFQCSTIDP